MYQIFFYKISDMTTNKRALKDRALKDRALKDRALKDMTINDRLCRTRDHQAQNDNSIALKKVFYDG